MWKAGSNLRPRLSPGVRLSGIVEPELPRGTDLSSAWGELCLTAHGGLTRSIAPP